MIKTLKKYLHTEYNKGLFKNLNYKNRIVVGVFVKVDLSTSINFIEFEMIQTINNENKVFNEKSLMRIYASPNHNLNAKNIDEKNTEKILGNDFGNYKFIENKR